MRAKYSIAVVVSLAAVAASAAPCPPGLAEIAARVAALRAVTGPFAPPCRTVDAAQLRAELDRKLRRDLPIAPERYVEALVRTGFVDGEPAAVYRHLLDFYCSQVLGFYEPEGDEMVIVDSGDGPRVDASLVWSHELEHAVQEHRFHLPSRLLAMRGDSDRQRAASAVAEGEAMLVMLLLNGSSQGGGEALDRAAAAIEHEGEQLDVPGVPDFFVRDLVFPYSAGLTAVLRAYRAGSWRQVDTLLAHPPASTAALLHPGAARPEPAVAADALPPVPHGWEEVLTDTIGEWGLAFLLGRRLPPAQAGALAAAWNGDRVRLVRSVAQPEWWALAWRIRCHDEPGRLALEGELQRTLPGLAARLAPADRLRFSWSASGRTLDVRAAWPPPSPRSPS